MGGSPKSSVGIHVHRQFRQTGAGVVGLGVGVGMEGGGSCEGYRKEAFNTKVPYVVVSTTSLGRQFQSLIVLSRTEEVFLLLFLSLTFFFLRAHDQHVDYPGAYNWGCSL